MSNKAKEIIAACGAAIMKWPPQGQVTFCNVATSFIACAAGYDHFRGLCANDIIDKMNKNPDFAKVTPNNGQKLANDGLLVIAGRKDDPHGHVAVVLPGSELVYSDKWKSDCPTLANVGKTNGVFGANWAFAEPPDYYAWLEPTV